MTTKGTGPIPIANDLMSLQKCENALELQEQSYVRHECDNRCASKGLLSCVQSVSNGDERQKCTANGNIHQKLPAISLS